MVAEIPVLYRVARRYTLDATLAEDLVGQTLLRAVAGWEQFDGQYPRAWLMTILHHAFLGHIRKQQSRPQIADEQEFDGESSYDLFQEVINRISSEELIRLIDSLPEDFRLAVVLCDVEEMTYEQAAMILQVPIGTVRSRLFRGRKKLQELFSSGGST